MWFTYILYSEKIDRYYVGYTDDIAWREERHNLGWGKYTRRGIPWKLVYHERYNTRVEAMRREKEIKRKKSRKYIESLINSERISDLNREAQ